MRTTKSAQDRRNEILDAAEEMFAVQGYDSTSVQQLIDKIGIAKGTFYYHFKSKEEVMDGIIDRYNSRLLSAARQVVENKELTVHEKIFQAIMSLKLDAPVGNEIIEELHKPQNALMHQKMLATMIQGVTPILAEIVKEGIEVGIFHTPYPYESAEMLITYTQVIFDDALFSLSAEEQGTRILAFIYNMECMFGAERGSFSYVTKLFCK